MKRFLGVGDWVRMVDKHTKSPLDRRGRITFLGPDEFTVETIVINPRDMEDYTLRYTFERDGTFLDMDGVPKTMRSDDYRVAPEDLARLKPWKPESEWADLKAQMRAALALEDDNQIEYVANKMTVFRRD